MRMSHVTQVEPARQNRSALIHAGPSSAVGHSPSGARGSKLLVTLTSEPLATQLTRRDTVLPADVRGQGARRPAHRLEFG
jgi:hypothetical protein